MSADLWAGLMIGGSLGVVLGGLLTLLLLLVSGSAALRDQAPKSAYGRPQDPRREGPRSRPAFSPPPPQQGQPG